MAEKGASGRKASPMIVLNVGGQRVCTLPETLTSESSWFRYLLSGHWPVPQLEDGSYFVDVDPITFEHVLNYLRRGVFPPF